MNKSKLKKITSARLFLPIVCLIAVLLLNVIKTPDFFNALESETAYFTVISLTLSIVLQSWLSLQSV